MKVLKTLKDFFCRRPKVTIYSGSALVGILSGFVVVAYRAAISLLEKYREASMDAILGSAGLLLAWLASAIAAGLLTARMTKRSPLIKGSGIPQVKALLMHKLDFDWKRELPFKFIGGSLALGAGLSLGREGPSIQLGALVGDAVDSLTQKHDYRHYLVTAGAAAGISAAFNAPLAGVLFCIEELHKNFSPTMLTSTLIASFCANAVMWLFFGSSAVFNIRLLQILPLRHYLSAVLLIGIASGLLGSLFNSGLLAFQKGFGRLVPGETRRIVIAFAAAAVISLFMASITGGGSQLVETIAVPGVPLTTIGLLLAGKLIFTLFSYASGAPGWHFPSDVDDRSLDWGGRADTFTRIRHRGRFSRQLHFAGDDGLLRRRRSCPDNRGGPDNGNGRQSGAFSGLHSGFGGRRSFIGVLGRGAHLRLAL